MNADTARPAAPKLRRLTDLGHGLDRMGAWRFDYMELPPEDGIVRTDMGDGVTLETKAGGTCDRCGMAITILCRVVRPEGFAIVGCDCAEFLGIDEAGRADIARLRAEYTKARAAATRAVRRTEAAKLAAAERARHVAAVVAEHEAELAQLDALAGGPPGFAVQVGTSMARQIRVQGKPLTDPQRELLAKLVAEAAAPPPASKHLGTVGQRITFEAVCTAATRTPNDAYPGSWRYTFGFRTTAGDALVWFASTDADGLGKGARVRVTATVKAHGTFREEAQTVLQRAKVVHLDRVARAAAPAVAAGMWRADLKNPADPGYLEVISVDGEALDGRDWCTVALYEAEGRRRVVGRTVDTIERCWADVIPGPPPGLPRVFAEEVRLSADGLVRAVVGAVDADGDHAVDLTPAPGARDTWTRVTCSFSPAKIVESFPTVVPAPAA